jgi:hypothetical protein
MYNIKFVKGMFLVIFFCCICLTGIVIYFYGSNRNYYNANQQLIKEVGHLTIQKDLRSHSIYKYQEIEKSNDDKEIAFLRLNIEHLKQQAVAEGDAYIAGVSRQKIRELSFKLMEKQEAEYNALKKELEK